MKKTAKATAGSSKVDLDRIIAKLSVAPAALTKKAISEARKHRDLLVPKLIEVVRDTSARAKAGDVPKGNAHLVALYLLSEFKAKKALPAVVETMSLPGDLPNDLYGDAICEVLPRTLASFSVEKEFLGRIIDNRELHYAVRWAAADTYIYLIQDGRLSRLEAVHLLQQHLRKSLTHNEIEIPGPLVSVLTSFAPKEAYEAIKETCYRGLVEGFIVSLKDVDKSIANGERHVKKSMARCTVSSKEEPIAVLKSWAVSRKKSPAKTTHAPPRLRVQDTTSLQNPPSKPAPSRRKRPAKPAPARRKRPAKPAAAPAKRRTSKPSSVERMESLTAKLPTQAAGRNAPCPCGSGRKFKKCCLGENR